MLLKIRADDLHKDRLLLNYFYIFTLITNFFICPSPIIGA
jgi:hypothetical protein